ncbi:MAG TPA: hypothetical protein VIS96_19435 [Terrimicrobiaceae bacterium]
MDTNKSEAKAAIEPVEMSKPQICETETNGKDEVQLETSQARGHAHFANRAIIRFGNAFCELEWHDRLSVIFATMLGFALTVVLSPILLVSWVFLLLSKRGNPSKRSNGLAFKSQQP